MNTKIPARVLRNLERLSKEGVDKLEHITDHELLELRDRRYSWIKVGLFTIACFGAGWLVGTFV